MTTADRLAALAERAGRDLEDVLFCRAVRDAIVAVLRPDAHGRCRVCCGQEIHHDGCTIGALARVIDAAMKETKP